MYAYPLRVPCTFYVRSLGARTYCNVRAPAVAVTSGASAGEDAGISLEDNGTTCLMAKFAIKFLIPYDVWASNFVDVSVHVCYTAVKTTPKASAVVLTAPCRG